MLVFDLHKTEASKVKRTSARKHEGLRIPNARNAIVRDRESGEYQAHTDVDLSEVAALKLRVNALELEVSRLQRNDAVTKGYASPLVGPSNVVPMSVARTARAEKESAVQVSHPLPVAGNEALVLPSPPEETPAKEFRKDFEPKVVGKVVGISSTVAANDPDIGSKEAADALLDISDVSATDVATLARGYGLTLVEASEILYREYSKRELHCYNRHGHSRETVRLERHMRQHIKCLPGGYVQVEHCQSGFKGWWSETESRMKYLRAVAEGRRVSEQRSPADHVPLVKGEAKYRRKKFLKDRAAAKAPNRAAFGRVQNTSRQLYVEPAVTTAGQVKAIGTWAFEMYQKSRKLFGMQPTVRNMKLRDEVSLLADLEVTNTYGGHLAKTLGLTPQEAKTIPMRELVRRYQRAGIV